jgi:hypothetical protein
MKTQKKAAVEPTPQEKKAPTFTLPTVILIAAIAGAAGVAVGRATGDSSTVASTDAPRPTSNIVADPQSTEALPVGHPAVSGAMNDPQSMPQTMPVGHPAVSGAPMTPPATGASTLQWTPPPRWQVAPNTSSMRLATYKIPHAAGDSEDADVSVTQVGGSVDANVDRWVGMFDQAGQKNVKRTQRVVNGLTVVIVDIQGTYTSGMDQNGTKPNWELLAAIVETPDMPHFFKITGPAKTVGSVRADLDTLVASVKN